MFYHVKLQTGIGRLSLLFRARFKWRLQENRFFLVFGLIIHFMATTTKAKRCIFISRTSKCPGYRSILNKSRRYLLFSALLRSQFGPIWISSPDCLKQQWSSVVSDQRPNWPLVTAKLELVPAKGGELI